jgi:hypothetical protein
VQFTRTLEKVRHLIIGVGIERLKATQHGNHVVVIDCALTDDVHLISCYRYRASHSTTTSKSNSRDFGLERWQCQRPPRTCRLAFFPS